jgi:hypothetical protein
MHSFNCIINLLNRKHSESGPLGSDFSKPKTDLTVTITTPEKPQLYFD